MSSVQVLQQPGYACPMIFDRSALYDIDVDLDTLRLADLASCPASYTDNDNHFVYYNNTQEIPVWCSDPVDGKAITPRELGAMLSRQLRQMEPGRPATELLNLLTNLEAVCLSPRHEAFQGKSSPNILPLVAESLTIVRVGAG